MLEFDIQIRLLFLEERKGYYESRKLSTFLRNRRFFCEDIGEDIILVNINYFRIAINCSKMFQGRHAVLNLHITEGSSPTPSDIEGAIYNIKHLVFIVEDYFKTNSTRWYYLETLYNKEILLVENNRALSPLGIVQTLQSGLPITPSQLKVLHTPPPSEQEEHYYFDHKGNYRDIHDFWISSLQSQMIDFISVSDDIEYFRSISQCFYPKEILGACMPTKEPGYTDCRFLETLDQDLTSDNLINVYMMNEPSETILCDFVDKYVILNTIY